MLFQYKENDELVCSVYKAQMGEKSCRTIKKKDRLLLPFGYAGSAMV
jgi:hypothetical protein